MFVQIGAWGSRWLPVTPALSIRAKLMDAGGPALLDRFMAELREEHLGGGAPPSVRGELAVAYRRVAAEA